MVFFHGEIGIRGETVWNSTEWKKELECKLGKYSCPKMELQGIQRGMSEKTWNYQEYDWKQL